MFHWIGLVQNSRGDTLGGWQIECVEVADGETVVPIFADENGTPISSVSQVANRAVSDENGNYDFFVPSGTYSLKFYNQAGVFARGLRFLPMYGAQASDADALAEPGGAELVGAAGGGTVQSALNGKQDTLVSGVNIKSINGVSILGSGDLEVAGGGGGGTVSWGGIAGTLADQTDLATALNARPLSTALALNTGAALIGVNDGASGALFTTLQGYRNYLVSSAGASAIGYNTNLTVAERLGLLPVSPEDFGAVALEDGGTGSQSTAIRDALESGRIVDGGGKTYVIGATVNPTDSTVTGLWNAKFVRLAANHTTQGFMIDLVGQPNIWVNNCSFNNGTVEDTGSNDDTGRIWLGVGSNNSSTATWLPGIRVTGCSFAGAGNGTPLLVRGTVGARIQDNDVLGRVVGGTPTNDAQNGIDITHSLDALVEGNRIDGLFTRVSGTSTRIYSRGILVTNSQNIRVLGNTIANVDQCIDFSGNISADTPVGNSGFTVANNVCRSYRTWGIKFANCARNGVCEGNIIRNFGLGGIVLAGQSGAWSGAASLATSNIKVAGNYIYDPSDLDGRTNCVGIWVILRAAFPGYPVNLQIFDNYINNTTGNGRLLNGILIADDDRVVVSGAPYNAVRGNTVIGATGAATVGCSPDGLCAVVGNSGNNAQPLANATWTSIDWAAETTDGEGMHSTTSNTDTIVISVPGPYIVGGNLSFAPNATGTRAIRFLRNGTPFPGSGNVGGAGDGTIPGGASNTAMVFCGVGDTLRMQGYQTSGNPLNVLRSDSQFYVRRIEQMGAS